jgi:hypothetical protein
LTGGIVTAQQRRFERAAKELAMSKPTVEQTKMDTEAIAYAWRDLLLGHFSGAEVLVPRQ